MHHEITTWRNGSPAKTGRIIRIAEFLNKAAKAAIDQDRLQAVIKNVPSEAQKIHKHDKHLTLIIILGAKSHDKSLFTATVYIYSNY